MGRRFLHEGRVVHAASIGLEKVHYQPAARREMAARAAQSAELLLHREQVLERPEGDVDEAEGFAQLKIGHIAVDKLDTITDRGRLVFELYSAAIQHRLGEIQAHHTQTYLGHVQQDSSGAAAQLEDRLALCPAALEIKVEILSARYRWQVVVGGGDKRLGRVGGRPGQAGGLR